MFSKDSVIGTIIVAAVLSVVCAVLVAGAAVALKPYQVANAAYDKKTNILVAAGLLEASETDRAKIDAEYKNVIVKIIDLDTGDFAENINVTSYDQLKAAKDLKLSKVLTEDLAGIKRREKYSLVYLIGSVENPNKIVLPVRGYGLWSTMYGFIALESDANTVAGFGFYQQGETPGLGGEVDNPKWKALWKGKKIYANGSEEPKINVIKGSVNSDTKDAEYKIDGLAGATLTSRGVSNLVQYWLGEQGFAKFLSKYKTQQADATQMQDAQSVNGENTNG